VTHDRALKVKPNICRPTSSACAPGLPPPAFTYSPWPETQVNDPFGREAGARVDGARRTPSMNTWSGFQVTVAARWTLPENTVHCAGVEKSSAPSTTTEDPSAWITRGFPAAPDAGTVTCSR